MRGMAQIGQFDLYQLWGNWPMVSSMSMRADSSGGLQKFEEDCLGAVLLDNTLTIQDMTDGVLSMSDFDRGYLLGKSALDVVHPDDLERAGRALNEALTTEGENLEGMYRLRFADGSFHFFAVKATTLTGPGDPQIVFQFAPVSPRLRAEEFAADTVNTLRMLAESHELTDCLERVHRLVERHILGVDLQIASHEATKTVFHTRASCDRFETRIDEGHELPDHVLKAMAAHGNGPWHSFNRMAEFDTDAGFGRITAVLTDDSDELLGYFVATRPSRTEPTNHEWMVYGLVRQVLTAVLRRVRLDDQIQLVSDSDPLTGLVNRRRLFRDMADVEDLQGTALLLIDLDRFSWFNNTLGHQVGDEALIAFAKNLTDLAPDNATVGRFGGDEFVVWLPGGIADARALAEQIHVTPARPASVTDLRATVRSSIGGITIEAGECVADAIGRADLAMYVVKDLGGDDSHFA